MFSDFWIIELSEDKFIEKVELGMCGNEKMGFGIGDLIVFG